MSIHYQIIQNQIVVGGQTFPLRESLKALGAKFDGQDKLWRLPHSEEAEKKIIGLCSAYGGKSISNDIDRRVKLNDNSDYSSDIVSKDQPEMHNKISEDNSKSNDWTIKQLLNKVQSTIVSNFNSPIWIIGEINNFSNRVSGVFFNINEIKNDSTQAQATLSVSCILWQDVYKKIKKQLAGDLDLILADGQKIRLLCQVSFYKERAQLSLVGLDLDPNYTKGALALARENLLKDLKSKGLAHLNKSLELSSWPLHIGLITAPASRAYGDFMDQMKVQNFPGTIYTCYAQMQGNNTTASVLAAIKKLDEYPLDLIVITRGGGSAADLVWFDSAEMCTFVCKLNIPVLAAIGHHDDLCVLEQIVFHKEKTPTAAADYICEHFKSLNSNLDKQKNQLLYMFSNTINYINEKNNSLRQTLFRKALDYLNSKTSTYQSKSDQLFVISNRIFDKKNEFLNNLKSAFKINAINHIENTKLSIQNKQNSLLSKAKIFVFNLSNSLENIEKSLLKFDPKPWLQKGWVRIFNESNDAISSILHIKIGQILKTRLIDGNLKLEVKELNNKTDNNGKSK